MRRINDQNPNELVTWMADDPHARQLFDRERGWSSKPMRMRWKKLRFQGKIAARVDKQWRRLYKLACGLAQGIDWAALDQKTRSRADAFNRLLAEFPKRLLDEGPPEVRT